MMKNIGIVISITLLLFFSCDTVEGPYIENPDNLVSTVTIFEFTGIECVNCPELGHETIEEYQDKFGENLQTIAIHGNEFGSPIHQFFLRTPEGQELAEKMGVSGLPKGSVNTLENGSTKVPTALGDDIAKLGYRFPDLSLEVEMEVMDTIAEVKIKGTFDQVLSANYNNLKLCVYLVQNHIIGPQKDLRGDHEEYVHKHAFRKSFNGIDGELYVTNPSAGMVVDEVVLRLNLNQALLIIEENQTIDDLELEPLVFVYEDNESKALIPFIVNYK